MTMQPVIGAVLAAALGATAIGTAAAGQSEFRLQGELAFDPHFASYADRVSRGLDAVGARDLADAMTPAYTAFSEGFAGSAPAPLGFDFSTDVPACAACGSLDGRFDLRADSDVEGLRLGALVRLGEDLTQKRRGLERSGWFFFAAADAQAVTWKLDRRLPLTQAMRLEEKQLVGDAQAGLAIRVAGGDLAIGYVHREIKHEKATATEQFGGLTFVVRR